MYYVAIDVIFTLINQPRSIMLGLFFKYGVILSHYSSIFSGQCTYYNNLFDKKFKSNINDLPQETFKASFIVDTYIQSYTNNYCYTYKPIVFYIL